MKERPILFSCPMVRALLKGMKTQTRRLVKPQPTNLAGPNFDGHWSDTIDPGVRYFACPYGVVGDRLWVKETFMPMPHLNAKAFYRASNGLVGGKWKPSIFMPRALSRITLEIAAVRIERLNAITEADAIAEGIDVFEDGAGFTVTPNGPWQRNPEDAYRNLWESINSPSSWALNPWVWVVTFRRIET